MSGVEGGRIGAWGALPLPAGEATRHARPSVRRDWSRAPAKIPTEIEIKVSRRTEAGRGLASRRFAIGFLAQAIAQERLVFGAREETIKPDLPNAAYRRVQGDVGASPGLITRIDLTV